MASLTAAWGSSRHVCAPPLNIALFLLLSGAALGWQAMQAAETYYWTRATRKFVELAQARAMTFDDPSSPPPPAGQLELLRRKEIHDSQMTRWLGIAGASASSFGTTLVIVAAMTSFRPGGCALFAPWLAWAG